jgi:Putative Ig domain
MSWIRFGSPSSFFTASAATDLWTAPSAHGLAANTPIMFYDVNDPTGTGVNIPSPLFNATTYYVAASGLTTTQFKTTYASGGAPVDLLTNSGGTGVWLFYDSAATGGPNYAPNFVIVPCRTGAGVDVNLVDAALRGRNYVPQPFLSYLSLVQVDEVFLPDGFVGHAYSITEELTDVATVALAPGSTLPPGLTLTANPSEFTISGTPTTAGAYSFILRMTRGTFLMDVPYHLTINDDPDSGAGGVGGG